MPESTPAIINLGPELKATDENKLCHWSEFYFLALLCHAYNSDQPLQVKPAMVIDGKPIPCLMIQKEMLKDLHFDGWGAHVTRNAKLGYPSALVLTGEYQDMIVLPMEDQYVSGRQFGPGLKRIDDLAQDLLVRNNEYIQGMYAEMKVVREQLRAQSYDDLYTKLKTHFLQKMEVSA